ncbi:MAG: preprotein translocase subunit SecA, partial [Patescibacteria group bacterium]
LIIAQAGRVGAVTIATNMAGRGVDIILGGNPPREHAADDVRAAGGLHVIGTERHEARRIDNQLRGRAGRQGDSGGSQFFVSLEDDLMKVFGPDRVKRMMQSFGIPEDQPIEHKMVSRALESAQSKIEGFHFDARKHVLEYDDVLNKQRDAIYRMRTEVLFSQEAGTPLREQIWGMIEEEARKIIEFHTSARSEGDWDPKEIFETFRAIADIPEEAGKKILEIAADTGGSDGKRASLEEYVLLLLKSQYDAKEASLGPEGMRNVEKVVMLRAIDILWMDHLDQMEHLRDSVRLRAYGQRDPLVEYKNEGVRLFRELQGAIRSQIVGSLYKVGGTIRPAISEKVEERHPDAVSLSVPAGIAAVTKQTKKPTEPEVGRNDPCPCGATHPDGRPKKYKHCHGKNV